MIALFNLLAGELKEVPTGDISGPGPLGGEGGFTNPAGLLQNVLSAIIGILTVAAIIWFVFQFIIGAFSWIGSSGDPKQVEAARSRIFNALVGLVIVIGALVLISLIGFLLGFRILDIEQGLCKARQAIDSSIVCPGERSRMFDFEL